jgi:hypothetical protein
MNYSYPIEIIDKTARVYACYFSMSKAVDRALTGPLPFPCRILTENSGRNRSGD